MTQGDTWLAELSRRMKKDVGNGAAPTPERMFVRSFLRKFGYERRGLNVVSFIGDSLRRRDLMTVPYFDGAFVSIDSTIAITLNPDSIGSVSKDDIHGGDNTTDKADDLVPRIKDLLPEQRELVSVKPDNPLATATTLMQFHNISQVPVMVNERSVKGVVSWKSIGTRLSLGLECNFVRDCMEPPIEFPGDQPLLEVINEIAEHGYALVRDDANIISGIVTGSDVFNRFRQLSQPFLLIGEIEGRLRNLMRGHFTSDKLKESSERSDPESEISRIDDLTLGELCRLLEMPGHWEKVKLPIDKKEFMSRIHKVREIRNDVMHFRSKGLSNEDPATLLTVSRFFRDLANMGVI